MAAEQLGLRDHNGLEMRPRRPSRGMYVLPSLFTAGNIALGYYAMTQSVQGSVAEPVYFDHAAMAIGVAALLDGVDGFIARVTHTASDFGHELDSLADVITFGVAPSLLAYIWGFRMLPLTAHPDLRENVLHAGVFVCFLFLVCGASRLARFNISTNLQPRNPGKPGHKFFVGSPYRRARNRRSSCPLFQRISYLDSSGPAGLAPAPSLHRLPHGQQLALLERQGGHLRRPPSSPFLHSDCGDLQPDRMEVEWALMIIAFGYLISGVFARIAYSWGRRRRRPQKSGPA